MLGAYAKVVGEDVIRHLRQLAEPLRGARVVHVNSTKVGGGVAEILYKLDPLMSELGLLSRWEVIAGEPEFYQCTKSMHNALQGEATGIPERLLRVFEKTNANSAEQLRPVLEEADFVFIHDPQPALLLAGCPERKGKWIWRCHIDVSRPFRPVWKFLARAVSGYDTSIFSLASFAQELPHPQYIVPPSIDPLSDKNIELDGSEIDAVYDQFGLKRQKPLLVQVSRFDRFKDPIGVIQAFQYAKSHAPGLQLVLAGGGAHDDPEGEAMLNLVMEAAREEPDVRVLLLPPDAHRTINALQRAADIVLQKSIREGFGLTVTEAMWKSKPVIGGDTGGIRLQVIDHQTGFLVNTPEGAALRVRYLLRQPDKIDELGARAREFVKDNFLITRQLREYLTLMHAVLRGAQDRIVLDE